jgi:hypothetical protein
MGIPMQQDVNRGDHPTKRVNVTSIVQATTAYPSAAVLFV